MLLSSPSLKRLLRPRSPETVRSIAEARERLDPDLRPGGARGERQVIGSLSAGCGATIGVAPACDFGCVGCYLGRNANATPPLPLAEAKAQMRLLRERLGPWGNLQLTDGEVTLRPESEVLDLLAAAREAELTPMLMTHGETFRRKPGLLERLMVDGGLEEVSVHVDLTQRGRSADYARVRTEAGLMPLRDDFAERIRRARARTGRPLRAASTCTVTPENLPEIPALARWFRDNADAFRLVGFQPAAQVGRSRAGLGGHVGAEDVWQAIARGLLGDDASAAERGAWLERRWPFGHPDCSQLLPGLVSRASGAARFEPVWPGSSSGSGSGSGDARAADDLRRFTRRWGGFGLRSKNGPPGRWLKAAALAGVAVRDPRLGLVALPRAARRFARALDPARPSRALLGAASGRHRPHPLTFSTHSFMSREELATPLGQERLRNCIFRVPVGGELVSMCEVNATDLRDTLYDQAAGRVPLTCSAGADAPPIAQPASA